MTVLVVGYGNSLRKDDGAGLRVAQAVAARELPGVTVLQLFDLAPELTQDLARARRVVFVDAVLGATTCTAVTTLRLEPGAGPAALTHTTDPRSLLALTERLHGHAPEAWMVTVPAFDLDVGEGLSRDTAAAVDEAVALVLALLS